MKHLFGPSFSVSYRHRWEEIVDAVYQPAFFMGRPEEELELMLRDCESNLYKYCFRWDDGPGLGIDGQYVVFTGSASVSDFGFVGGFNYYVLFDRIAVGLEAGLYRYLRQEVKWGGTHTYYLVATLGYQF